MDVDFEALFEDHFDAIYGYLARRVGPEIARDLAAETVTCAYAGPTTSPTGGSSRAGRSFRLAHGRTSWNACAMTL
jgi:DNA-directed RNA polymerase specialized sigma24 family protein